VNLYLISGIFAFLFLVSPKTVKAYNSLDQGYASDRPEILNCGGACFGSPEIQTIINTGFEIEKRGLYVEQEDQPSVQIQAPWSTSRTKWLRRLGRNLYHQNTKYSSSAFRIGVAIQDQDKSFTSAFWGEIRKPILYDLRNKIVSSYKKRQKNKVGAWAVEQTLDIGASALGLDSYGYISDVLDSDDIIDRRSSIVTKFKPRLDPYKGRYGAALQSKFYRGARDPFYFELSYFYCNNEYGVGDRICSYLHQVQTTFGYKIRANQRDISIQLSVYWEAKSLDPEAYVVDDEPYDFKPLGFQSRISIAI
jgi:hypothetical protein